MTGNVGSKPGMGERLKTLLAEYGALAMTIYLTIFALVFVAAATAISFGLSFEGVTAGAGTLAGAWVATKLTQPVRILATLALTPIAARVFRKRRPGGQ